MAHAYEDCALLAGERRPSGQSSQPTEVVLVEQRVPRDENGETHPAVDEPWWPQPSLTQCGERLGDATTLALDDAGAVGHPGVPAQVVEPGVDGALAAWATELRLSHAPQATRAGDDETIVE